MVKSSGFRRIHPNGKISIFELGADRVLYKFIEAPILALI